MLWLRSLDRVDARQLDGTEDAQDPFWSPDLRSIGFFASGTLRQIPAEGGAVKVINQIRGDFRGATWGTRDTILVASGAQGVVSMNAMGGAITPVTVVDTSRQENTRRNPSFLRSTSRLFPDPTKNCCCRRAVDTNPAGARMAVRCTTFLKIAS
jgi:hypothetical protein